MVVMTQIMKLQNLILGFLLLPCFLSAQAPTGGGVIPVKMNPVLPANLLNQPLGKENQGFTLIFDDEFDSLDTKKWNLAEKGDDMGCDGAGIIKQPELVSVTPEGYLRLIVKEDRKNGCPNVSGEVKTVSAFDDFHSYWFYPGSYVEIRTLMPFGNNVGTAGWLFASWQPEYHEIDIWENYGKESDSYQADYIWGKKVGKTDIISTKVQLQDTNGKPFSYIGKWMTFGLEWETNKINYYINNQLFQSLDLTKAPPEISVHNTTGYFPTSAFELRLGIGGHLNTNPRKKSRRISLPNGETKELLVDYVRVYRLPNYEAIHEWVIPKEMGLTSEGVSGDNISCTYYPDATYTWTSAAFDFKPNMPPHYFKHNQWMTVKKGIAPNQSYPVSLVIRFPWGYTITKSWDIYVKAI